MPMTPSEFKNPLLFGSISEHNHHTIPMSITSPLLFHSISQDPSSSSSAAPNFRRSNSAPIMAALTEQTVPVDYKTEQHVSKSIVRQVVPLFVAYLSLSVLIYWLNQDSYLGIQTHPLVDALYFCVVTMCTIGYGDITPGSAVTKLLSVLSVFVGFCFMGMLFAGMATYVLDIQDDCMSEDLRDGSFDDPAEKKWYLIDFARVRRRIKSKVGTALGAVALCLGFGVLIMHFVEEIGWFDSFYFSFMSITTVGYGDVAFKTLPGRLLAAIWLLVSTLALARAFLYVVAARVDKSNRVRAKRVLSENLSVSQFFAADIDHNGSISIAEFVIHKLKMMGKITDKDIIPIAHIFDKLDRTSSGRITLSDRMETSNNDFSTATSA